MKSIHLILTLSLLLAVSSCQKRNQDVHYDFNATYKISNASKYIHLDSLSYTGRYGELITEIDPILPFEKTVYSEDYVPLYFMAYGEYKEGENSFFSDLEMKISGSFSEFTNGSSSSHTGIGRSLKAGFRQYSSADTALLNDTLIISLDQIGF